MYGNACMMVSREAIPRLIIQRHLIDSMVELTGQFRDAGGKFEKQPRYAVIPSLDEEIDVEAILLQGRPASIQFIEATLESDGRDVKVVVANIEAKPLVVTLSISAGTWGSGLLQKRVEAGDTKKFVFPLPKAPTASVQYFIRAYVTANQVYELYVNFLDKPTDEE